MRSNDRLKVAPGGNVDERVVAGFGQEWDAYDQTSLSSEEFDQLFDTYFHIFPWHRLPRQAEGFDLGCGSGRWAAGVAPRVARLHCIDPAAQALAVAKRRLSGAANVDFLHATADTIPLADNSQDFGYCLGVLHHIPDTLAGLDACVRKLKPGAPFLLYLYYRFDNKPAWYRRLWQVSELGRLLISRLPFAMRKAATTLLAAGIYWPLARIARAAERRSMDVSNFPLSHYRGQSFYTMRTDALDRFGTRLEKRFTRAEIEESMNRAGLRDIVFSEREPFWTACGIKR